MLKMDFTKEEARKYFDYDDGFLRWRPRDRSEFKTEKDFLAWNKKYPGSVAGSIGSKGYRVVVVRIDGVRRTGLAHRVVWSWHHGPTDIEIDHKDNDNTNNRIGNLREATSSQNKVNRRQFRDVASPFNGVSYEASRKRWKAGIRKGSGSTVTIGRFRCPTMAAFAYDREAASEFGEFAKLNFPRPDRSTEQVA